jgi:uncharacterized protein
MDILKNHKFIALDTCVWIYHFENHPIYSSWTRQVLHTLSTEQYSTVMSEVSMLEILVQSLRLGLSEAAKNYQVLLDNFPNLIIYPVTRQVALNAAKLRAKYNLRTPDALILATGIVQGATLMVTNDAAWKRVVEIHVVCLDDLISSS